MHYKDPSWGWPTKLLAAVVFLTILWWNFTSEVFFRPINMAVLKTTEGNWIIASERLLPWGPVSGKTDAFMQVLGRENGQECQWHTEGLFVPRENNITHYDITHWAAPCLDAGPPISIQFSRQIYFLGFIPLRPVHYAFMLNPDNAPVTVTQEQ